MNGLKIFLLLGFIFLLAPQIGYTDVVIPIVTNQECPVSPIQKGNCWTTEDVLQSEIDHHAQSAMLRMFAKGGKSAVIASALLCSVKNKEIAGIYLPDQGVPAQRARLADPVSNWWDIIPSGRYSKCYREPPQLAPLIAFRKQIKDSKDFVETALTEAFEECQLPQAAPRCYIATISKPDPPEPEPVDPEFPPDSDLHVTVLGPKGSVVNVSNGVLSKSKTTIAADETVTFVVPAGEYTVVVSGPKPLAVNTTEGRWVRLGYSPGPKPFGGALFRTCTVKWSCEVKSSPPLLGRFKPETRIVQAPTAIKVALGSGPVRHVGKSADQRTSGLCANPINTCKICTSSQPNTLCKIKYSPDP